MLNRFFFTVRYYLATGLSFLSFAVGAEEYFDPALVEVAAPEQSVSDLSGFSAGSQAPGVYRVDIYVNQQKQETRDVTFRTLGKEDKRLFPCLSRAVLESYGVKVEDYPKLQDDGKGCVDLSQIPDANSTFLFNEQRLQLDFPQQAINVRARGYIPPERWDDGINALIMNYSYSGVDYLSDSSGGGKRTDYLNLRPGMNLGAWRLRNYTTWYNDGNGQDSWDTIYTYAQREIVPLQGQLLLGDGVSPSDVFDNVSFRARLRPGGTRYCPYQRRSGDPPEQLHYLPHHRRARRV